jgi:hypothetical protein
MGSDSLEVVIPGELPLFIHRCRAHEKVISDDPLGGDVLLLQPPYRGAEGRMTDPTQAIMRVIEDANFLIVTMMIGRMCA